MLVASSALWLWSCIVETAPVVSSTPAAVLTAPSMATWGFHVRVVSGTQSGGVAPGTFSVLEGNLPAGGTGTTNADSFTFAWEGQTMTQADLDAPMQVRFEGGTPIELVGTGGPQQRRFGFSTGFERGQFGREEESFIAQGRPYFGYLDPDTYVDGAGVVEFGPRQSSAVGSGEREDHHCGPDFGGARCGTQRCCSMYGWCGSPGEDHCGSAHGHSGQYDGPGAPLQ